MYLGSLIDNNGRMDAEVDRRIASASRVFGALHSAVFKDRHLNITTKRKVYQACALSVLLYGSECWTLLRKHHKRLNAFHHRCIRTILAITSHQQWELHITSEMTRELWGDLETVTAKVIKRRLEWLGHVARMPNQRIQKMALFGWLPEPRPPGGPRKRWRDQIRQDLKAVGVSEEDWYEEASHTDRASWRAIYHQGLQGQHSQQEVPTQPQNQVHCQECGRSFRREGDRARHKCTAERQRPVCERRGAVQCPTCSRWFRSQGGRAVHRCGPTDPPNTNRPNTRTQSARQNTTQQSGQVQCQECLCWFRRASDQTRHKCTAEREKPVQEQRGTVQCTTCERWFLSWGGLAVHRCEPNI